MKNFEFENLTELNNNQLIETFGGDRQAGVAFGCGVALAGVTVAACTGGVGLLVAGAFILADAIL